MAIFYIIGIQGHWFTVKIRHFILSCVYGVHSTTVQLEMWTFKEEQLCMMLVRSTYGCFAPIFITLTEHP